MMRAVRSGRFMGSLGNAGPTRQGGGGRANDFAVLRAGIPGFRGLAGAGLGSTASASASGDGGFDWGGFAEALGAATTGAAKIIDSARADTSPDASVGSTSAPLYQPAYTPPAPTPPASTGSSQWISGVSNGVVLAGGAAVLLGGIYLMTRRK